MRNLGIIHGGWEQVMPKIDSRKADLILTDPPYNISRATAFANYRNGDPRFAVNMDFGKWDAVEIDLPAFAKECYRVLRKSGTVIIFYDLWKIESLKKALEDAGFGMVRLIIWQKTNPVPLNSKAFYLTNSREVAVTAVRDGAPTFHSKYDSGDTYSLPIPRHGGKKVHPTQKPLDLFEKLVLKHSNPRDMIIDPFMGSGTTAVAAVRHDRRFFGCDIDENYVNITNDRVTKECKKGAK